MSETKKKIERGKDYITQKWAALAITGVGILILGIVLIFTRENMFKSNVDDIGFVIYIISDYLQIRLGFSIHHVFFLLSLYASNYFVEIMTMQLYIGLIICAIGEVLSILGFIRVQQLDKNFWSRLFEKLEF